MAPGTLVDPTELWQTVVAAAAAGIGVTIVFSVAILGFARSSDANRRGNSLASIGWLSVALAGLLATAGAIVVGVIVMTSK